MRYAMIKTGAWKHIDVRRAAKVISQYHGRTFSVKALRQMLVSDKLCAEAGVRRVDNTRRPKPTSEGRIWVPFKILATLGNFRAEQIWHESDLELEPHKADVLAAVHQHHQAALSQGWKFKAHAYAPHQLPQAYEFSHQLREGIYPPGGAVVTGYHIRREELRTFNMASEDVPGFLASGVKAEHQVNSRMLSLERKVQNAHNSAELNEIAADAGNGW